MSDLADWYSFDWSTADYVAECHRLRHAIRQLAEHTNPNRIYLGEWITKREEPADDLDARGVDAAGVPRSTADGGAWGPEPEDWGHG